VFLVLYFPLPVLVVLGCIALLVIGLASCGRVPPAGLVVGVVTATALLLAEHSAGELSS
jgi:hypothetical protein